MSPAVEVTGVAQKNLILSLDGIEYQKHVSSIDWTPGYSPAEWRGGTPDAVLTDPGSPVWTANVTAIQDWENPDSLFNFLLAHAGEQVDAKYTPVAGGAFSIDATLTLAAPTIGGAVNVFNEATIAMGSTAPVPTFPPPTIPDAAAAKVPAAKGEPVTT